jgi:hypothetical protein
MLSHDPHSVWQGPKTPGSYQFIESFDSIEVLEFPPDFLYSQWGRAVLVVLALDTYDSKVLVHA